MSITSQAFFTKTSLIYFENSEIKFALGSNYSTCFSQLKKFSHEIGTDIVNTFVNPYTKVTQSIYLYANYTRFLNSFLRRRNSVIKRKAKCSFRQNLLKFKDLYWKKSNMTYLKKQPRRFYLCQETLIKVRRLLIAIGNGVKYIYIYRYRYVYFIGSYLPC